MARRIARAGRLAFAVFLFSQLLVGRAAAELVVSQLIVEFRPDGPRTADIEIFNNSEERAYAVVEPREVLDPGTPGERRVSTPDPARLGLIASPARFILEPQQRRTLRIAAIGTAAERERVYRVTVKPVTGDVSGSASGLKLLVGYDLLVLVRPSVVRNAVHTQRSGSKLILTNDGNASVELAEGEQCDLSGKNCRPLPARRLYAGASWTQDMPTARHGRYQVRSTEGWSTVSF